MLENGQAIEIFKFSQRSIQKSTRKMCTITWFHTEYASQDKSLVAMSSNIVEVLSQVWITLAGVQIIYE